MTEIRYNSGTRPGPLADLLRAWPGETPDWFWYEPRPGCLLGTDLTARDLHPTLRRGPVADLPGVVKIDEARLFWPTGSVHLVGGSGQVRWFQWSTDRAPAWLGGSASTTETRAVRKQVPYGVLLRKTYAAFGLDDKLPAQHAAAKLQVAEFWDGQNLFAWTLLETGGATEKES